MTVTKNHPTGLAAFASTILVYILTQLGVDIPAEVSAAIVGLVSILVSALSPRVVEIVEGEASDAGIDLSKIPAE